MDYNKNDIIKKQIYVNAIYDSGGTGIYRFVHSDGELRNFPERDFYINVPLKRSSNIYEYVDTKKQENIYTIERQNINPQFIDQEFFKNVYRIKSTNGQSLTPKMIQKLRADYFTDNYNVLASFPLQRLGEVTNSSSSYYGLTGIYINNRPPEGSYSPSYIRIKNNGVYDGVYPVSLIWIDTYDNIGAFFIPDWYMNIWDWDIQGASGGWNITYETGMVDLLSDVIPQTDTDIRDWFESIGRNEIPSYSYKEDEFTLDTLEKADLCLNNVVSHSMFYPIKINK